MTTLTRYSWRDVPREGWEINGKMDITKFLHTTYVLPTNAYTNERYWLDHVVDVFPKLQFVKEVYLTGNQLQGVVFDIIASLNKRVAKIHHQRLFSIGI